MHTTPASLLQRLRQPSPQQAWEQFVELYTPLIYAWAARLNLQSQDAADLVQDVFTLLLQKLPGFDYDHTKSFRAWLRTVTLNKWRESLRRAGTPLQRQEAALDQLAGPGPPDDVDGAEYRHYLVGRALQLMQAEFPATTWKACWEVVVQGRPAAEVAAEFHIRPSAVYVAKYRVLRRLRQDLAGLMD
jgi:RNA polymerase sigma-70 factor, ECF subfamily